VLQNCKKRKLSKLSVNFDNKKLFYKICEKTMQNKTINDIISNVIVNVKNVEEYKWEILYY